MKRFIGTFCALLFSVSAVVKAQNLTVSGGHNYSVIVCNSGKVFAWGNNNEGQLGLVETSPGVYAENPVSQTNTPQELDGLPEIFQIDAGSGSHALALTCQGQVVSWGNNAFGQLGDPSLPTGQLDANTGQHSHDPVNVIGVGGVGTLDGVTYVTGSTNSSFAVTADGRVVSWGDNTNGELGRGAPGGIDATPDYVQLDASVGGGDLQNVIFVEAGDYGAIALVDDDGDGVGTVYSWGTTTNNWTARATGADNRAAPVELANSDPLTGIVSISAGDAHALAVDVNGNVWSWGGDWGPGQLGQGTGYQNNNYAARVVGGATGDTYLGDSDPITRISAGQASSAAVSASGEMYVWGGSRFYSSPQVDPSGVLADGCNYTATGNSGISEEPMIALDGPGSPISNVIDISDGDAWYFAIKDDGTIWASGANNEGQIGDATLPIGTNACYFRQLDIPLCEPSYACPEPELSDTTEVCLGDDWTFDGGFIYPGFSAEWQVNGVVVHTDNLSIADPPTKTTYTMTGIALAQLGTVTLTVTDNRAPTDRPCEPCATVVTETEVVLYEAPFSDPGDLEYCAGGPTGGCSAGEASVNVNGTASGEYEWYTDLVAGTLLGNTTASGSTCIDMTNVSSTGTAPNRIFTVYVEDVSSVSGVVRPDAEAASFSGDALRDPGSTQEEDWIFFDAPKDITINSIDVEVGGYNTSDLIIYVRDAGGTIVDSYTMVGIALSGGTVQMITIPVDLQVPAGAGYYLDLERGTGDASINWYQNGPANWFPQMYQAGGQDVLRLVGNGPDFSVHFAEWSSPGIWNWDISTGSDYPCGRLPVTITEDCPPCTTPTSITVEDNGSAIADGGTYEVCDGGDVNLDLSAAWPTPAGGSLNTDFEFYVKDATDTEIFTSSTIDGSSTTTGTATWTVTGVAATFSGTYTIGIRNTTSCELEQTVVIDVFAPTDPVVADDTVCVGDAINLPATSTVTGGRTLVYTWDGPGANDGTGNPFNVSASATAAMAGTYVVTVTSNGCAAANTASLELTVNDVPADPVFTTNPATICEGTSGVVFEIGAVADADSYTWNYTGTGETINGTSESITIDFAAGATSGDLEVTAVNSCGSSNTVTHAITIDPPANFTTQPVDETICEGEDVTFTSVATGPGTTSYQWYGPSGMLAGETGSDLALTVVPTTDAGDYYVEFTASCGAIYSDTVTLTVNPNTTITVHPADETACETDNVTFTVTATGTAPLSYAWDHNSGTAVGTDAASLTLSNISIADAGTYGVEVTGGCGNPVTSNLADLTVNTAPSIDTEPVDLGLCAGSNASFSVVASGTPTLTYAWEKDGASIAGATSDVLNLSSITAADGGVYEVTVTNGCGSVTSVPATLTITLTEFPSVSVAVSDTSICEGETVTFTATGNATGAGPMYTFYDGSGTELQAASPSLTYTTGALTADLDVYVEMLSNSTCIDATAVNPATSNTEGVVVVTPPSVPVIDQPDQQICVADINLTIAALTSGTATWSTDFGTVTPPTGESTTLSMGAGVATVDVEVSSGPECPVETDQVVITRIGDMTTPNAGADDNVCESDNVVLSANNNLIAGETGTWTLPAGVSLVSGTLNDPNAVVSAGPGTYELIWTVENGVCPTAEDRVELVIDEIPSPVALDATSITTCSAKINLNAQTPLPASAVGTWTITAEDNPGGSVTQPNNPTSSADINDDVTEFTWTVVNGQCPAQTAVLTVDKLGDITPPIITLTGGIYTGEDVSGQVVDLCEGFTYDIAGATPDGTVGETGLWSDNGGTNATIVLDATEAQTLTLDAAGTQNVLSWTIDNPIPTCLPETKSVTINVIPPPVAPVITEDDDTICSTDDPLILTATGNGGAYQWLLNGAEIDGATSIPLTDVDEEGEYTLIETHPLCGSVESDPYNLSVDFPPVIVPEPKLVTIFMNESESVNLNTTADSVNWTNAPDFIDDPSSFNPTFSPVSSADEGDFTILIVGYQGVCQSTEEVTVTVRTPVIIPNTFTPNGDNQNEVWNIPGISTYSDAIVKVYNRWGGLVYEVYGGYTDPWDGKRNGKELPSATYYYVIDLGVEDINGQFHKGDVTIYK